MAKNYCKDKFGWRENETRLYSLSAGMSGILCNFITNPLWLVRTRMQSEAFKNSSSEHYDKKYKHGASSLFRNIRHIANTEGFLALYKGYTASLMGIVHPLVFFPLYEKLKIYFKNNHEAPGADKLSNKFIIFSSVVSKILSSLASYPHEVLRSRMQFHKENMQSIEDFQNKTRLIGLIRKIIKTEGYRALYAGFVANLVRIVPNYAIIFLIYENMCHWL